GPEGEGADRVAGELLAPAFDQDLLAATRPVGADAEAREARAGHAPGSLGIRAGVVVDGRRAADGTVHRVQDVHVRVRREVRIQGHAEQTAVPEVVHVPAEVLHQERAAIGQAVELHDLSALLAAVHATVVGELYNSTV